MPNTQKAINDICAYMGIPRIPKGVRCEVDGEVGVIWGGNSAANFNVKFEDGRIRNCHPGWRMKIFSDDGEILHASDDA